MQYLISTNRPILETWQVQVDAARGYPEPLSDLRQVGRGPHAPLELGRAMHFAEVLVDQTGTRFALPFSDAIPVPSGVQVVDALPNDWYPPMPGI